MVRAWLSPISTVVFGGLAILLLAIGIVGPLHRGDVERSHPPPSPCMALTDPTVHADAKGRPVPIFEAVDADATVLLQRYDPQGAALQHIYPILLTELHHDAFQSCNPGRDTYSFTPIGTPAIFLDIDRLSTPQLRAAGLSHELVHVAHDQGFPLHHHSWLRHVFLPEEGEAHLHNLLLSHLLHTPSQGNPVGQLVIQTFPFEFGLLSSCCAYLAWHGRKRRKQ